MFLIFSTSDCTAFPILEENIIDKPVSSIFLQSYVTTKETQRGNEWWESDRT